MQMKTIASGLLLGLLLTTGAGAQIYREGYGRPDRYYQGRGANPVDRAIEDLRRARSLRWSDHRDRKNLEKAESELFKFQERWSRGHFDTHHLDEAISRMQQLANSYMISPRDRETLSQNLYALREFRSSRGDRYWDGRRY